MLVHVELRAIRNLAALALDLDERATLLEGRNAQGKTSFLESLYLLATTRSFRARDPRDAISFGESEAYVKGRVLDPHGDPLEMGISLFRERGRKRLFVGKSEAKLPEYLGLLPALALSGESVRSIVGSPSERRRLIDRATAAAKGEHLEDLGEYRRALAQRNRLLKTGGSDDELEPWEEILARVGRRLANRRIEQIEGWQEELASWPGLFPESVGVRFRYRRSGKPDLATRLREGRSEDRRQGFTQVGPHRDDLGLENEGRNLWRFGSAGQVRSSLAALTLAQARRVRAAHGGSKPLLLLDDVDTDLDQARLAALLAEAGSEAQVIAATSKRGVDLGEEARSIRVEEGVLHAC